MAMKKPTPPQSLVLKEHTETILEAERVRKSAHEAFTKKIKKKSDFSSLKEWKSESYALSAEAITFQDLASNVVHRSAELTSKLATFSAAFSLANNSITQLACDVASLNAILSNEGAVSTVGNMSNELKKEVVALDQKSEEFNVENLNRSIAVVSTDYVNITNAVTVLISDYNALNAAVEEYLKLV